MGSINKIAPFCCVMDGATLKLFASRRCKGGVGVTLLQPFETVNGIASDVLNEMQPTTPAEWLPPALILPTGPGVAIWQ